MTRVEERASIRPAFFTSTVTASIGRPISEAAISACSLWSSVMPDAAKIASSSVGGSHRTRRGPYLVFQYWLIADPLCSRQISRDGYVALQYEIDVAIQLCVFRRQRFSTRVASNISIAEAPAARDLRLRTKSREAGTAK